MSGPTHHPTSIPDSLGALSNPVRLHLLEVLADTTTPVSVERLSRQLANQVARAGQGGDHNVERLRIALVHIHLPMLRKADILRFDGDRNQVGQGPNFEPVRAVYREVRGTLEA